MDKEWSSYDSVEHNLISEGFHHRCLHPDSCNDYSYTDLLCPIVVDQ